MVKHKLLLKWWFVFIMTVIFSAILHNLGMFEYVWKNDSSKLSFVTIAMFFGYMLVAGWLSYKTEFLLNKGKVLQEEIDTIVVYEDAGWFLSEIIFGIGLLGTLLGLLITLSGGLANVDPTNPASIHAVLSDMSYGTSTAILTTVVSLICANILKTSLFILNHSTKLLPRKLVAKDPLFGLDKE